MFKLFKKTTQVQDAKPTGFKRFQLEHQRLLEEARSEPDRKVAKALVEEMIQLRQEYFSSPEWVEMQAMEAALRHKQHLEYQGFKKAETKPAKKKATKRTATKFVEQPA